MRPFLPTLLLLGIAACQAAPDRASTSQTSASAPAAVEHAAVAAVCDTVLSHWQALGPVAEARRVDTTARVNSDADAQTGCAVLASAPQGLDRAQWSRLYWAADSASGWTELLAYMADGPDGGSRTLQRGAVRCQIERSQDGGDDSDSTYVASPAVGEVTFCWEHPSDAP